MASTRVAIGGIDDGYDRGRGRRRGPVRVGGRDDGVIIVGLRRRRLRGESIVAAGVIPTTALLLLLSLCLSASTSKSFCRAFVTPTSKTTSTTIRTGTTHSLGCGGADKNPSYAGLTKIVGASAAELDVRRTSNGMYLAAKKNRKGRGGGGDDESNESARRGTDGDERRRVDAVTKGVENGDKGGGDDTKGLLPDTNDPRVFRKIQRKKEAAAAERKRRKQGGGGRQGQKRKKSDADAEEEARRIRLLKRRQGELASESMNLPEQPLVQTISGGTSMIFDMVLKMLVWEQEDAATATNAAVAAAAGERGRSDDERDGGNAPFWSAGGHTLPRWKPTAGISDINPSFRTQSPVMNNQGYAGTIWRNVRKRNKPAMWRYALRTYDRMELQQRQQQEQQQQEQEQQRSSSAVGGGGTPMIRVDRTNVHYEGALLACAKLGLWERAVEIYDEVRSRERNMLALLSMPPSTSSSSSSPSPSSSLQNVAPSSGLSSSSTMTTAATAAATLDPNSALNVRVTENMVTSLIRACVRASRKKYADEDACDIYDEESSDDQDDESNCRIPTAERRKPLDAACRILRQLDRDNNEVGGDNTATTRERNGNGIDRVRSSPLSSSSSSSFPLVARHWNPIAASYQSLGLTGEAADVIRSNLSDRQTRIEPENGADPFNINDVGAMDKSSYSLLVRGCVSDKNWDGAVEALMEMTETGLYPTRRQLHAWYEVSERRRKHRATRSWKKKRDEYWIERAK